MSSKARLLYPATPKNIDERVTEPSAGFRAEAKRVLWGIAYFIATYIVLVIGAVVLAVLCGFAGFALMVAWPSFISLAVGLGLIGLGLMVLFFLLKFVFSSTVVDRSNLVEIKRDQQPVLFEFIGRLAAETQTPLPKRIYLSPDVNASVFYDSGFWSMFLPIRKNLQIGLGLVNAVNVSEFKAIIAHEFGHFSQRSMKLGSYVYNMNKVIYNLLYDNNGYGKTLESWASISGYFSFFANITIQIVQGIQSVLQSLYGTINKRYMALSREMEFHADAVAASVSGSQPLTTALRRLDVVANCYDSVLGAYDRLFSENRKALNLYTDHTELMHLYAKDFNLALADGLVQVTADSFGHLPKSRVSIKDQWASHPSTDDREAHLNRLNINAELVRESAWALFTHVEALQKQITEHVYRNVTFETTPEPVDADNFRKLFQEFVSAHSFDKAYKGYYDNRSITEFDVDAVAQQAPTHHTMEEILTPDTVRLPDQLAALQAEVNVLTEIEKDSVAIETFEFDGQKHHKADAARLLKTVRQQQENAKAALLQADESLFKLYCANDGHGGEEARERYRSMFAEISRLENEISETGGTMRTVHPLFQGSVSVETAQSISNTMLRKDKPMKESIRAMLADTVYEALCTPADKKALTVYLDTKRPYFELSRLDGEAINIFIEGLQAYSSVLAKRRLALQKQTLARQLQAIAPSLAQ